MPIEFLALVFVLSLFLGSFYNVVALRTLKKEEFIKTSSHCVTCGHELNILDMFPVLSWLLLGGKCRYCKTKISGIYPFGEMLTAIAYTLIVYVFGFTYDTIIHIVFVTIMVFATVADLKDKIVPDRFWIVGVVGVLGLRLYQIALNQVELSYVIQHYLLAGVISFMVMYSILIISGGKMGGADVKAYALIGLTIGASNALCSLFYASFIGLLFYIPKFLISRKRPLTDDEKENPFIPPIFIGVLLTYIVNIYSFMFV